ncbi:MAG: ACP S-malonyltransferase [Proteobacteria bacterium]|nr:ACP S-malonyltransferase [Pseudomonadota bacterium]MBU1714277.1 ACP S-malonyltransferase [Pseudomonadota bacterium]
MTNGKKIAFIFPGQGSQYVGMGQEFLATDPGAGALIDQAEKISGMPIRKLCLEGPMEELTRTACLQPAMTVMNLISWQSLQKAGVSADYMVGHSLGEYAALCASGILSVEDTLALVTERGRLMEREAAKNPGGMHAILGLVMAEVQEIISGLSGGGKITAANHNSEKQIVISGEQSALEAAAAVVTEKGGKSIPLKVSGAWHSELVKDAVPDFTEAMAKVSFNRPLVPVLFNVTAAVETDPAEIRRIMARQIASTVRWFEIINFLIEQKVDTFIEVGPKTVLTGLMKKIVPKGYEYNAFQVDSPATLEKCLENI